jgi:hypothetical protein
MSPPRMRTLRQRSSADLEKIAYDWKSLRRCVSAAARITEASFRNALPPTNRWGQGYEPLQRAGVRWWEWFAIGPASFAAGVLTACSAAADRKHYRNEPRGSTTRDG